MFVFRFKYIGMLTFFSLASSGDYKSKRRYIPVHRCRRNDTKLCDVIQTALQKLYRPVPSERQHQGSAVEFFVG